jgi:hypothetical protein
MAKSKTDFKLDPPVILEDWLSFFIIRLGTLINPLFAVKKIKKIKKIKKNGRKAHKVCKHESTLSLSSVLLKISPQPKDVGAQHSMLPFHMPFA